MLAMEALSEESSDGRISRVQHYLHELGYSITDSEGEYGNSTRNAVFMFQNEQGIEPTGSVDEGTWLSLLLLADPDRFTQEQSAIITDPKPYRRNTPFSGEIPVAKSRLIMLGHDCRNTNTEIDNLFVDTLLAFQKDHEISETGILDADTREKIESSLNLRTLFPVVRENDFGGLSFGLIDSSGSMIAPAIYTSFDYDGIYHLRNEEEHEGMWGVKYMVENNFFSSSGERIEIDPENSRGYMGNGFFWVYSHSGDNRNYYDLVNSRGDVITKDFNEGYNISGPDDVSIGFGWISDPTHWWMDFEGNILLKEKNRIYDLGEGWFYIKNDDVILNLFDDSLCINRNGLIPSQFSDGICITKSDNKNVPKQVAFNTEGEMVFETAYDDVGCFHNERCWVKSDDLYGFINTAGIMRIPCCYAEVTDYKDGFASVRLPDSNIYNVINTEGNNPIPDIWSEKPILFNNGKARIIQDGKVGFADSKGNMLISCEWDLYDIEEKIEKGAIYPGWYSSFMEYTRFIGDLTLVARNDKLYYINSEGAIVSSAGPNRPFQYEISSGTSPKIEEDNQSQRLLSSSACVDVAVGYLKDHLKNPTSLQIHSQSATVDGFECTVIIDYSAMNSFGGYNRSTYICIVDARDGTVNMAYVQ